MYSFGTQKHDRQVQIFQQLKLCSGPLSIKLTLCYIALAVNLNEKTTHYQYELLPYAEVESTLQSNEKSIRFAF